MQPDFAKGLSKGQQGNGPPGSPELGFATKEMCPVYAGGWGCPSPHRVREPRAWFWTRVWWALSTVEPRNGAARLLPKLEGVGAHRGGKQASP